MGTLCGDVCTCRQLWDVPEPAARLLVGGTAGHVLPVVARTAGSLGLHVQPAAGLLEITDPRGRGRVDRLLARLAHELTAAETEAVRVLADPPQDPTRLAAALLGAPSLAVELARRGVTVEAGVLTDAELRSVYQPVVSLADRSVTGHEALLRGVVDGREVSGADLFFVAEAAGWLDRLDRAGREAAVVGAAGWLDEDADLYVNVHPAAVLRPAVDLAGLEAAAHEAGLAGRRLVIEVVEAHAATDRGHLLAVLEHVRSSGWRVALDDAGTGWSSAALLRAVRPEVVKLTKGLVQALPDDGARALVRSLVDLAHRSGAVVVAQGVETEELAEEVAALGADLGQGWLFGRPTPPPAPGRSPAGSRWQQVAPA